MNKEVKNVGDPCGCPTVCYKPGGLKCAITGEVNQIQKFHEGVPVDRTISEAIVALGSTVDPPVTEPPSQRDGFKEE